MKSSSKFVASLFAGSALASPAFAQLAPPAPIHQSVDQNGVNLFDGNLYVNGPVLSMGQSDPQGLQFYKLSRNNGWTDNIVAGLDLEGTIVTVSLAGFTDIFTVSGSTYTNTQGNGATLTSTLSTYTYTRADGTLIHFSKNLSTPAPYYANQGRPTDITFPSGLKLVFTYQDQIYCLTWKTGGSGTFCTNTAHMYRPLTVRNSYGYQLSFAYNYDYDYNPDSPETQPNFYLWSQSNGVTATNLAVSSGASTPTQTWSSPTGYFQVTDPMGRVTKYRMSGNQVLGITLPGSTSEDETINYTSGRVTSVVTPAGTTNYGSSDLSGVRTVTVTDPLSHVTTYTFDIASQTLTSVTDPNSHTTAAQYDTYGRITQVTKPEGNYTHWTYDGRGNITEQRQVAKSGSGLSDVVATASYPSTCSNPLTCNEPTTTIAPNGAATDYTYDATSGSVLTITRPAPLPGAVRPQTRYSYSSLQAYFKNTSGSIVASGEPVVMLTGISACQTTASCTGTSDETKATIGYGPQTTGVGNNLLPVSISRGDGTGALTATTAYTYDDVGNTTYVDGPLSGTADTTRALYDADREQLGSIDPDPDGAGALLNRAVRNTIDSRGLLTKVELGTTSGQTDAAWAAFSTAQQVDITYDSRRRVTTRKLSSGGTNYALAQTDYYSDDRLQCSALRMNTSVYASLPSSACTLGTQGSYGPDRISKNVYDNAGQLTQVQVAVGTSDAANERTLSYTNNGMLQTLTDGENNKTTYVFDGFDRLSQSQYPSATKGSGTSNPSDYEQLTYDADSNVSQYRARSGDLIGLSHDYLDRLIHKGGSSIADRDYTWDNLDRMLTSIFSTGGLGVTNTYDALSRLTSSTTNMDGIARTMNSQYDLAGNRTLLTGNTAGYYAPFSYDVLGRMTAYTGVVQFGYDDLGRRISMNMGTSGTTSSVSDGYDPVSRLTSNIHDLAGTTADQNVAYGYNPGSQITTRTASNDTYAFTGLSNSNTSSTSNGLNQITASGPASLTYDANGNLTSDGSNNYTYDPENHLISVSGAHTATLSYDPLGRLWQISSPSGTTRFVYDGDEDVIEMDGSGNAQRVFVWGGADEPLVWWEGPGPKLLHADERGSIIAIADNSGNLVGANSYDEYGTPGSANQGRFQYTGQMWLSEVGLYYYKARFYSPSLGRFMQTDPIGPADDANLYAYVLNDPVNFVDPTGLSVTINCSAPDCSTIFINGSEPPQPPSASFTIGGAGGGGRPPKDRLDCALADPTMCPIYIHGRRFPPPPPPPPSPPTKPPRPKPKQTTTEQICAAIAGGAGLYALREMGEVAQGLFKGKNALQIIVQVGKEEAATDIIAAVGIASVTVYGADRLSGGRITDLIADRLGCPK